MAELPIIKLGHPTLRKVAKPVEKFNVSLKRLVDNMIETMRVNEGIGLAAPQLNLLDRVFVIDKKLINEEWEAQAYINPKILSTEGSDLFEEGCLSIPGIRAEVERSFKIKVSYQTVEGKEIIEQLEGLHTRVFQHEYDHLEGVLFIDRLPNLTRKLLEPQIKDLEEANIYH